MIDVNQLRKGIAFLQGEEILKVTEYSHHKPGRGKATIQYLYDDGQFYVFMDNETYEQPNLAHSVIGEDARWLKENQELELLFYEGEVIDYNLPLNVELEVVEAEHALAGDTATGATKEVITETGVKVRTPLFISVGDVIRVDTRSAEYITRV